MNYALALIDYVDSAHGRTGAARLACAGAGETSPVGLSPLFEQNTDSAGSRCNRCDSTTPDFSGAAVESAHGRTGAARLACAGAAQTCAVGLAALLEQNTDSAGSRCNRCDSTTPDFSGAPAQASAKRGTAVSDIPTEARIDEIYAARRRRADLQYAIESEEARGRRRFRRGKYRAKRGGVRP